MRKNKDRPFDDSKFPINNLTVERAEQIEKVAMPLLKEMLEKLRRNSPHLFRSPKK